MVISNIFSGTRHDNSKVRVMTVGGLGGALQTGRASDYRNAGDGSRKLCTLCLGMMARMGVQLTRFGDADSRLQRL